MVDSSVVGMERTELIEEEFGKLAMAVPYVDNFFPYRPEEIPPNSVVMYFDWRGTSARSTGSIYRKEWEWIIELYIHGYTREDVQRRMKAVLIGIDQAIEGNPKLNRAASKAVEIQNMGPPIPLRVEDEGGGLLKRFRLIAEAEQV